MKKCFIIFLVIPLMSFSEVHKSSNLERDGLSFEKSITTFNHNQWNALLVKYVTKDGQVDYNGFKADENKLHAYLELLSENEPSEFWTKNETLAYWINAYNAFTIQLILDNSPLKSIRDIKDPWDVEFIRIADKTYSLGVIEHEILRKMNEPRIHFAINCASYSCPNLLNEAYTSADLETQLEGATHRFVNDTSKNIITKKDVEISKIFEWFSEDFESYGTIIDFLNTYSTIKINEKAEVIYKDYNWNLND